jgi:Ca-activated chloride channel family protein
MTATPSRSFTLSLSVLVLVVACAPIPAQPGAFAREAEPPAASVLAVAPPAPALPPVRLVVANDGEPAQEVSVTRVAVEAQVFGHLAETRMTLTFSNPNARALAGDLVFPLPPDATISGYALDVAGRMVDGVIVRQDEARRVFELEARKGVDPGLVEHTRGNVFKTRVFPIPGRGSRTVRLAWVSPLEQRGPSQVYHLPLNFPERLSEATVRVEALASEAPARLDTSPGLKLAFDARHVAEATLRDRPLVEELRVVVPSSGSAALVQRSASGRQAGASWFSVRELVPPPADLPAPPIRRVALLWDASMSRQSADREREIRLLSAWLRTLGQVRVDLTVFRDTVGPVEPFALPSRLRDLEARLTGLVPDGGTRVDLLGQLRLSGDVDAIIVVSDGLATLGPTPALRLPAPTWFLSSSGVAAHAALAGLAAANGGAFLDLARVHDAEVLAALGRPVWSLLSVEVVSGRGVVHPLGPVPAVGAVHVAGQLMTPELELRLSFGLPGQPPRVTRRHRLRQADAARAGESLRLAWAQARLAELSADTIRNAEAIQQLGADHGLVTSGTSLLVLETLGQYLDHDVEPPASWPEMHARWRVAKDATVAEERATERGRLDEVAAAWADEVAWYRRDFKPEAVRPVRKAADDLFSATGEGGAGGLGASGDGSGGMARSGAGSGGGGGFGSGSGTAPRAAAAPSAPPPEEPKVATAHGTDARPEATINIRPWDPEVPWTKALKAEKGDLEARYLALRAEHGAAPSFYLDVAEFFLARGDRALGLRVLSNLAELRLDEPALLRVLAHRFAQVGELDLAVHVFELVLTLRPEEPQSHRDLALVLGRRGLEARGQPDDLRRAVTLLAQVVRRRWDRFDGVEITALHELNRFVALAPPGSLGELPLDRRFIESLPLDLRVTMSWDADLTDMDLHVVDPRGEEASYANNLTAIGGRVSRDFTEGYGPETFSLRKAVRGEYELRARFYATRALALAGAVTLQVEVITNWGRPDEKREALTLRLTAAKEDFVVGRVAF